MSKFEKKSEGFEAVTNQGRKSKTKSFINKDQRPYNQNETKRYNDQNRIVSTSLPRNRVTNTLGIALDTFVANKKLKFTTTLQFINGLEHLMYNYENSENKVKDYHYFQRVKIFLINYFYNNHKKKIPGQERFHNSLDFQNYVLNIDEKRYLAGFLVFNTHDEILCGINSENKVNLPKGKEDFDDNGDKKLTAIRELAEETGLVLTLDEYKDLNRYVEYTPHGKYSKTRLYIIMNINKNRVQLNHQRRGEIYGLRWIDVKQLNLLTKKFKTNEYGNLTSTVLFLKVAKDIVENSAHFKLVERRNSKFKMDFSNNVQGFQELRKKLLRSNLKTYN